MASGVLKMRKFSFFVSEQIVVFNLVKQTCMKLLNKMQHITLLTPRLLRGNAVHYKSIMVYLNKCIFQQALTHCEVITTWLFCCSLILISCDINSLFDSTAVMIYCYKCLHHYSACTLCPFAFGLEGL